MARCVEYKRKIKRNGYQFSIVRRTRSANAFKPVFFWCKVLTVFLCHACGKKPVRIEQLFDPEKRKQALKYAQLRDW